MKVNRMILTILVSVSMAFIMACSEQKTASLEGNEDIAAGIQKLAECYDNPETAREIYAENAVLKWQDGETAQIREQKGLTEIEKYYKGRGENYGTCRPHPHPEKRWGFIFFSSRLQTDPATNETRQRENRRPVLCRAGW